MRGTTKTLLEYGKEINTLSEISLTQKKFYENLFQKAMAKSISDIEMFLSDIHLPTISDENYNICEAEITGDNLLGALKSMPNHKTPGKDGLSKEFYETFWEDIEDVFINSLKQVKIEDSLKYITKTSCYKTFRKKDKYKRCIKNWRPISFLNIDTERNF